MTDRQLNYLAGVTGIIAILVIMGVRVLPFPYSTAHSGILAIILFAILLAFYVLLSMIAVSSTRWWQTILLAIVGGMILSLAAANLRTDGSVGYDLFISTFEDKLSPHLSDDQFTPYEPLERQTESLNKGIPPGHLYVYTLSVNILSIDRLEQMGHQLINQYQCHAIGVSPTTFDTLPPATTGLSLIFQIFPFIAGILTILFTYLLSQHIGTNPHIVTLSLPLVPIIMINVPGWNIVYAPFAVALVWLMLQGRPGAFLGSILLYLFSTLNPLFLTLYVLVVIYWFMMIEITPDEKSYPLQQLALLIIGVVIVRYGFSRLIPGFDPVELSTLERVRGATWLSWLITLYAFIFMVGLPFVVYGIQKILQKALHSRQKAFAGALLGTFILLFSVNYLNESSQVALWTYLVPFCLIVLIHEENWRRIIVMQGVMVFVLTIALAPLVRPDNISEPPPPLPVAAAPLANEINARIDEYLILQSWNGGVVDNQLVVDMVWQVDGDVPTPYQFSLLPVSPDGVPSEPILWQIHEQTVPTNCWSPGHPVQISVSAPLPEDAAPGGWFFSLAAFRDGDALVAGDRITTTLPDGTNDTQIGLGPVIVE